MIKALLIITLVVSWVSFLGISVFISHFIDILDKYKSEIVKAQSEFESTDVRYRWSEKENRSLNKILNTLKYDNPYKFYQLFGVVYAIFTSSGDLHSIIVKDFNKYIKDSKLAEKYADELVDTLNKGLNDK
jgi:predicted PurR-regulated permease PerM